MQNLFKTDRQRVALIGGGGFIGSHLSHHLAATTDWELLVLDRSDYKLGLRFDGAPCGFLHCDVHQDAKLVEQAIAEADWVVNLAAFVRPVSFLRTPLSVVELNLFRSLAVVEACVQHRSRLLHFSTSEVYGKSGGSEAPFHEDRSDCILGPIANQRWIYSSAKQLLDRIIQAQAQEHGLEYTIVRPFNFVGPLMDWFGVSETEGPARVFASFLTALLEGRPLQLVDGGAQRRCFTYIDDAVRAVGLLMAQADASRNQIINIGNPASETTISDLARLIRELYRQEVDADAAAPIVSVPGQEFYGAGYEDCDRRLPDVSKLSALGWTPEYDLRATFLASLRGSMQLRDALRAESVLAPCA